MVNIGARLEISPSNHNEFHIYYLAKHSKLWTRRMHLIGTATGVTGAAVSLIRLDPIGAAASVAAGVAISYAGDFLIEKTRPTSLKYPIWSVMSNFQMISSMLKGDLSI